MACSSYLGNISWSPQLTVMIEHWMILNDIRVAQIVASWHPGCRKMEGEWENEEEMEREEEMGRKWTDNEEMKREWGNEEEMAIQWGNKEEIEREEMERDSLSTFPHSLFFSSLSIHFLQQNLSQNVKWKLKIVIPKLRTVQIWGYCPYSGWEFSFKMRQWTMTGSFTHSSRQSVSQSRGASGKRTYWFPFWIWADVG